MARKQFKIPDAKMAKLAEFAALSGTSSRAVVGAWIRSFAKNGSDYVPPAMRRVEAHVPDDILEAAENRAKENGFTLRDMVMFEIDEIDRL